MIRMKDNQFKSAQALIRNLCCNYDRSTGDCLLLDHGDVVKCPQMLTQNLVCRYFNNVLLEDLDAKVLKAEIMGTDHVKVCEGCGKHFRAISNRAKYCARCSKRAERKRKAEWARKNRTV